MTEPVKPWRDPTPLLMSGEDDSIAKDKTKNYGHLDSIEAWDDCAYVRRNLGSADICVLP